MGTASVSRSKSPFSFGEGDKNTILQATAHAMTFVDPDFPFDKRGEMLAQIFHQILLKRTYGTFVDGMMIGALIPAQKNKIVRLDIAESEKQKLAKIQKTKSHSRW
jgi:hypothetical protein